MQRENPIVNAFYQSKAWYKVRTNYYKSKFGICERCGGNGKIVHHKQYITVNNITDTDITLNWNNLELLCIDCHNREHFEDVSYAFDDDGNLVNKNNRPREIKAL